MNIGNEVNIVRGVERGIQFVGVQVIHNIVELLLFGRVHHVVQGVLVKVKELLPVDDDESQMEQNHRHQESNQVDLGHVYLLQEEELVEIEPRETLPQKINESPQEPVLHSRNENSSFQNRLFQFISQVTPQKQLDHLQPQSNTFVHNQLVTEKILQFSHENDVVDEHADEDADVDEGVVGQVVGGVFVVDDDDQRNVYENPPAEEVGDHVAEVIEISILCRVLLQRQSEEKK